MCGISGIMHKRVQTKGLAPIGQELTRMLWSLAHRGMDSTGMTIAGQDSKEDFIFRLWTEKEIDVLGPVIDKIEANGGEIKTKSQHDQYIRLTINYEGDIKPIAETLYNTPGVQIHSIGRVSEIVKDLGTAKDVDKIHNLDTMEGSHGIGHVRLATESRVDITHSHPFWAYPFPDISVVHNGQLTNYHKMKGHYEMMGHRFQTQNDSELIAVYLAEKLSKGESLDQALRNSLDDLDGTFTYLVSTDNGIGYAKDRWSAKPLVIMETDEVVAMASEEIALRSVFSEELDRIEPQENEVNTWLI
jgi:hypothetical protein